MSDSIEFVKSKLAELVSEFINVEYTYRFDDSDNAHIVYAQPGRNHHKFDKRCVEIDLEFMAKYPYEVLYFVDDSEYLEGCQVMAKRSLAN